MSILLKCFVHLLFWSFVSVILKAVCNHSKSKPQVYVLLLNFEHRSAGVAEWKREANYGSSSATSDRYLWRREDKKGGRSKLYGGGIFWSQAENWTLTVREVIVVSIRWHRFWHLDILTYWCVGDVSGSILTRVMHHHLAKTKINPQSFQFTTALGPRELQRNVF